MRICTLGAATIKQFSLSYNPFRFPENIAHFLLHKCTWIFNTITSFSMFVYHLFNCTFSGCVWQHFRYFLFIPSHQICIAPLTRKWHDWQLFFVWKKCYHAIFHMCFTPKKGGNWPATWRLLQQVFFLFHTHTHTS